VEPLASHREEDAVARKSSAPVGVRLRGGSGVRDRNGGGCRRRPGLVEVVLLLGRASLCEFLPCLAGRHRSSRGGVCAVVVRAAVLPAPRLGGHWHSAGAGCWLELAGAGGVVAPRMQATGIMCMCDRPHPVGPRRSSPRGRRWSWGSWALGRFPSAAAFVNHEARGERVIADACRRVSCILSAYVFVCVPRCRRVPHRVPRATRFLFLFYNIAFVLPLTHVSHTYNTQLTE